MTKNKGQQETINLEEALNKIDKDRFPRLYKTTEKLMESKKAEESLKVRAERAERKAKQANANPEGGGTPKKPKSKKEGFDYAEKAYLKTSDVTPDEFPLVQEIMSSTGKTLDEVLESKYFRAEQKELREAKESADAVPTGTKRSGQSSRDKVGYWLVKGEMPPADQPKLRREYVNAKLKKETDGSKFTDQPVVE